MVGAEPEACGIEIVQTLDPAAQGAPEHPVIVGLGHTLSRQLLGGAATMALRGVCVFAASMAIIWVLRLIPVLRKWML